MHSHCSHNNPHVILPQCCLSSLMLLVPPSPFLSYPRPQLLHAPTQPPSRPAALGDPGCASINGNINGVILHDYHIVTFIYNDGQSNNMTPTRRRLGSRFTHNTDLSSQYLFVSSLCASPTHLPLRDAHNTPEVRKSCYSHPHN